MNCKEGIWVCRIYVHMHYAAICFLAARGTKTACDIQLIDGGQIETFIHMNISQNADGYMYEIFQKMSPNIFHGGGRGTGVKT